MQIYSHFHRGDYDRRHLLRESGKHRLVEKTLTPLEESRRAFRLVGDILVERTVGEVLPSVESNRKNIDEVLGSLTVRLQEKQKETLEWKNKYNIRTQEEVQASNGSVTGNK
mmetsp:Transcript_32069/g.73780  ORF Transcript_32069/g.73780 Transcript_32069/m.73780 type:complete len:112 (-) Transcript_32069:318-653(-)